MKILIAVDGSDYSLAAVEEAARLPWPQGSVVKIISAVEAPLPMVAYTVPVPSGDYAAWERAFEEKAATNIARALSRFTDLAETPVETTNKTIKGEPKEVIINEADQWGADLIIVGTHGYNAFERMWLGSVSRTVVAHTHCSVHIVRRGKGMRTGGLKILLAVDGSDYGERAVEEVAARPWPAETEVRTVSAVHLPVTPTPETWALPDSYYANLERAANDQAEEAVSRALERLNASNSERTHSLTLSQTAVMGHPEEVIIGTAKEWGADLIVLGSHGYRGFQRFLLGSVSQAVASHAPCSVEVVRAPRLVGKEQTGRNENDHR